MFKVELFLNNKQHSTKKYEEAVTIKEIVSAENLSAMDTISFKLNNEFVNSSKIIIEDCKLDCIGFNSEEGFRIYQDSAIFIMAKAFYDLFPHKWNLVVEHSIGDGIYCEIFKADKFGEDEITQLKEKMQEIVARHYYIESVELPNEEAIKIFQRQERFDVVRNLRYNMRGFVPVFRCGEYYDYYIRQLCDNTGLITEFEINYNAPGFVLRFPLRETRKVKEKFVYPKKVFSIHQESDKWLNILRSHNASDLNEKIENFEILNSIQIEEALHEKKIVNIAKFISDREDIRAIFLAGPSSSGKTTFAKRLSIQLQVNGIIPIVIGLDEYFFPRTHTPRKPDGDFDFENIKAIDLDHFNEHMRELISGGTVELPKYNFIYGTREKSNHIVKLKDNNVLLIEGIHGLNDELSEAISNEQKVKLYISCLNQLNIDHHNRIATTYFRKIRRIVRDNNFRGYTAEMTLERWESIREGEHKYIFPHQENADMMFNSGLIYEINVLKKHVLPLLYRISKHSPVYTEAQKIIFLVEHLLDIPDDMVPSNSIIREFIGNSIFKY